MKLVQKILSHGLLIAFIVAAFFIYMNRVDLFPQWFAKKTPATAEPAKKQAGSPAAVTAQLSRPDVAEDAKAPAPAESGSAVTAPVAETPDDTPVNDQLQSGAADDQPADVAQSPAADGSGPAFRPLTEKETASIEADDGSVAGEDAGEQQVDLVSAPQQASGDNAPPVTAAPAAAGKTGAADVPPADVAQSPAVDESGPAFRPLTEKEAASIEVDAVSVTETEASEQQADIVSAAPEESRDSAQPVTAGQAAGGVGTAPEASDYQVRLEQARSYFWERDLTAAMQAYQSLAESYPDRAEIWGELGNLYFSIRKTTDATDAYAHALGLLIEQGDAAGARELLSVMYRLDARRASQFEMRLRQTGG